MYGKHHHNHESDIGGGITYYLSNVLYGWSTK